MPANGTAGPIYAMTGPMSNQTPPGLVYYRDTAGVLRVKWVFDTSALQQVTEASGASIAQKAAIGPYSSDGAAVRADSAFIEAYARNYAAQADGSVTSAELLPAAGLGLKWVIWDLQICTRVALTGGSGGRFTLSDMASGKGSLIESGIYGILNHPGPYKQGTANTAINISAAAGSTTALTLIFITWRCAKVA